MQLFESMRISCKADDATGVVIKSMYCNIGYEERERERERETVVRFDARREE